MNTQLLRLFALLGYVSPFLCQTASGQQQDTHWAFQPLRNVGVPHLEADWPENPIDSFILQKLNTAQLQPAKPVSYTHLTLPTKA